METAQFINLLHHFSGSTSEDADAVLKLKKDYPFSQLLHALSARVCQDHGFSNSKTELQLAAVYAADRAVLKEIMTLEFNPSTDSLESLKQHHQNVVAEAKFSQSQPDHSDVADQVLSDLERLHQLKHNFELMFVDGSTESIPLTISHEKSVSEETTLKESTKSKKERIRELAKAYIPTYPESGPQEDVLRTTRRSRKKETSESLMNDLESKQELGPESEKHKEQLEIIDHFIRIQPSILNIKDKEANTNDLTTIKTGEFGDNIISETLAEILIKQGKKEKAIEVLKKLIWKFPQKKTYFAAQIEELRK